MKREKKAKPSQYVQSLNNMRVLNYNVYNMGKMEKLLYTLLAFVVGAAVGYLFYGGLGKDDYGNSTQITYICNVAISCLVGFVAVRLFIPVRTRQLCVKRQKELRNQFADMLEALATSLSAGKNVNDSFQGIYGDMKIQYGKNAYIVYEIQVILAGVNNNIPIEDLLMHFGRRSGVKDIENFAQVFSTAFRKGGNLKDIIQNTHEIIHDKMSIEMDIESVVASNKMEQNIMIVLPILLVGFIKMTSPEFASNFASGSGIAATTIAIGCFVAAYFIGQKILDIKL
jgi:tight adherence protein B